MGRSGPRVQPKVTSTSLNNALQIKGPVRVRPYGNVKHAHVILRKVEDEEFEDEHGRRRKRGVFSLFAHKLINVKPGKELFMYLHPVGGDLEERVVAFEADIPLEDEMESSEPAKTEETVVQSQPEQVLPPRMRKTQWLRKPSLPTQSSTSTADDTPSKVSVGIQVGSQISTAEIQNIAQKRLAVSETISTEHYTERYVISDADLTADLQRSDVVSSNESSGIEGNVEDRGSCCESASETRVSSALTNAAERLSLTPMELDSPSTTPAYTPELSPADLPSGIVKKEPVEVFLTQSKARPPPARPGLLPPLSTPRYERERRTTDDLQMTSAVTLVDPRHADEDVGRPEDIPVAAPLPPTQASPPPTSDTIPTPLSMLSMPPSAPTQSSTSSNVQSPLNSIPALSQEKLKELADLASKLTKAQALSVPSSSKVMLDHATPIVSSPASYSMPPASSTRTQTQTDMPAPISIPLSASEPARPPSPKPRLSNRFSNAPIFVPASQPVLTLPTTSPTSLKRPRSPYNSITNMTPRDETLTHLSKRIRQIVKEEPSSPVLRMHNGSTDHGDSMARWMSNTDASLHAYGGTRWSGRSTPTNNSRSRPESSEAISRPGDTFPSLRTYPTYDVFDLTPAEGYVRRTAIDLTLPSKPPPSAVLPANPITLMKPTTMNPHCSTSSTHAEYVSGLRQLRTAEIKMRKDCGVRSIVFSPSGRLFAVICRDNTVRVWDNTTYTEIAKLAHSSMVISVVWLDSDSSLTSLGANGIASKWSMIGENNWDWEKLVDAGDKDPSCLDYSNGRLAISHPRRGINLWMLERGRFRLDRHIPQAGVLVVNFLDNGENLLCGASDGTVYYVNVATLRITHVTTFKTKVFKFTIDHKRRYALIAQASNRAHLIDMDTSNPNTLGQNLQDFSLHELNYPGKPSNAFGAVFANRGESVIFGSMGEKALLWDKRSGRITYELDHVDDPVVQALATFEGDLGERYIISGTRSGILYWWAFPWDAW